MAIPILSESAIWMRIVLRNKRIIDFMESASYVSSGGMLPDEIYENIVFTTLFRAGLSPQEAEVWIGRELEGAQVSSSPTSSRSASPLLAMPIAGPGPRPTTLGITRESMLTLKKRKSMF